MAKRAAKVNSRTIASQTSSNYAGSSFPMHIPLHLEAAYRRQPAHLLQTCGALLVAGRQAGHERLEAPQLGLDAVQDSAVGVRRAWRTRSAMRAPAKSPLCGRVGNDGHQYDKNDLPRVTGDSHCLYTPRVLRVPLHLEAVELHRLVGAASACGRAATLHHLQDGGFALQHTAPGLAQADVYLVCHGVHP